MAITLFGNSKNMTFNWSFFAFTRFILLNDTNTLTRNATAGHNYIHCRSLCNWVADTKTTWIYLYSDWKKCMWNNKYGGIKSLHEWLKQFSTHYWLDGGCFSCCHSAACTCVHEQLLLQNYKAQSHAVFFFKDTLSIEDENFLKACRSVCSSVC